MTSSTLARPPSSAGSSTGSRPSTPADQPWPHPTGGLQRLGVPHGIAHQIGSMSPVSSLFAAVLGVNPLEHLLAASRVLPTLPAASQRAITGRRFFPELISGPFHHGLVVVFIVATGLSVVAAVASLRRGGRYVHPAAGEPAKTAAQASRASRVSRPRQRSGRGLASRGRTAASRTPTRDHHPARSRQSRR